MHSTRLIRDILPLKLQRALAMLIKRMAPATDEEQW
jgi:hypothetical protein